MGAPAEQPFAVGTLAATVAAVLFDPEARKPSKSANPKFGKLREPVLRLTAWARAFGAEEMAPEVIEILWDTRYAYSLGQHPFRAPSVFNFFHAGLCQYDYALRV